MPETSQQRFVRVALQAKGADRRRKFDLYTEEMETPEELYRKVLAGLEHAYKEGNLLYQLPETDKSVNVEQVETVEILTSRPSSNE